MNRRTLTLLLFLGISMHEPALAQSPPSSASFAGEWRPGPRAWVVIIAQEGMKVRGSWKELYRDKQVTCSGVWFEGTISDDRITGSFHPCGGKTLTEPLDMKIINADTLEMRTLTPGGTSRISSLRRIK